MIRCGINRPCLYTTPPKTLAGNWSPSLGVGLWSSEGRIQHSGPGLTRCENLPHCVIRGFIYSGKKQSKRNVDNNVDMTWENNHRKLKKFCFQLWVFLQHTRKSFAFFGVLVLFWGFQYFDSLIHGVDPVFVNVYVAHQQVHIVTGRSLWNILNWIS